MTILAKTTKGQEFIYDMRTAHRVNSAKANKVCEILNNIKWHLSEGQEWHRYEVDKYDNAFLWAETQQFRAGKTGITEVKG